MVEENTPNLVYFLVSWALYLLGDLVIRFDNDLFSTYRPYNWLMIKSVLIQDAGGGYGPWKDSEPHIS